MHYILIKNSDQIMIKKNSYHFLIDFQDFLIILLFTKNFNEYIPYEPGDYCEGVIPDPIPNSEVKPFSADGTLP